MTIMPPFVICTALSPTRIMAAGTADGRLWIGLGGSREASGRKKKKKVAKWGGLREDDELFVKVAEGPIVALSVVVIWHSICGRTDVPLQRVHRSYDLDILHIAW